MRGQFRTQQTGVGARDDEMQALTEQPVHEEMPAFHVLDFIKEKVLDVVAIYAVKGFQDEVQVFHGEFAQAVVVKIDIAVPDAGFAQRHMTKRGFTAPAHADDHLRQFAVEGDEAGLVSMHEILADHRGQLSLLFKDKPE